jgi:predicted Zn-dependent protease/TolB-like protein
MWRPLCSARCLLLLSSIALIVNDSLSAQQPAPSAGTVVSSLQQGVYLVFPFENAGSSPRYDWIGEGLEELTIQRVAAAGEQVYSHAGRLAELERYGLPSSAKLSRATMLRAAEDLDADFVIFGKFSASGTSLTIEARILRVNPTRLLPPIRETATLDGLMALHLRVLWRVLSAADPRYPLSLAEFSKRQRYLRLDAFEHYIRGLLTGEDDARLRELREAARLEPEWPDPDFALGDLYFTRRDCNSALPWYARLPKTYDRYTEAVFATGICRLLLGQPDRAEEVFVALQNALRTNMVSGADLPEILNDLAIARTRQGKLAEAQAALRRASELDPDEDDYVFNLGLLALQSNDAVAAADHFREAVEREPDNPEDRAMLILSLERAGKKSEADQERETATETFGPNGLPAIHADAKSDFVTRMNRLKMELDINALRAGLISPGLPTNAPEATESSDSAAAHIRRARQELSAGHVEAAEKEFQAVLAGDPGNATAHRGLGEIYRRQGKMDDAVKELQSSLAARDSAVVRMVLAKIYLDQKKPELARVEVEHALKLAPNYPEAKQLLEHLQNSKPAGKKPGGGAP